MPIDNSIMVIIIGLKDVVNLYIKEYIYPQYV